MRMFGPNLFPEMFFSGKEHAEIQRNSFPEHHPKRSKKRVRVYT